MTQPDLSILICSIDSRVAMFDALTRSLWAQVLVLLDPTRVELQCLVDNRELKVGEKRNRLMNMARGRYLCFIDDDDRVFADYVPKILDAIAREPDAVGICGFMTTGRGDPTLFIDHTEFSLHRTRNGWIKRKFCHLCPMKTEIARSEKFAALNYGEDRDWGERVNRHIKTSVLIPEPIYYYDFDQEKSETYKLRGQR